MSEVEWLSDAASLGGLTKMGRLRIARLGLAVGHGHDTILARSLDVKHRIVCQR
jgi:hypothetical protein